MSDGWVKMYRSIVDWEWYKDIPTRVTFEHLILTANHAPGKWRGRYIKRGQTLTSYNIIAAETGLTYKQVRRAVEKLKNTGELGTEKADQGLLITVENYNVYQGDDMEAGQTEGTQRADRGQTEGTQRATNKNNKNNNNKKNNKNLSPRAREIPPRLEYVKAYADVRAGEGHARVDPDDFFDFYESKGWTVGKAKMKDWQAAFRTWERSREKKPQKKTFADLAKEQEEAYWRSQDL